MVTSDVHDYLRCAVILPSDGSLIADTLQMARP